MVPELVAAYGFSCRKAAPRPHLSTPTDKLNNFLANGLGQVVTPPEVSLNAITEQLSGSFGLPPGVLLSRSREQRTSFVRQLAMYLGRQLTEQSYSVIGRHFGRLPTIEP